MRAITAASNLEHDSLLGVFEGATLTFDEFVDGRTLEEVQQSSIRNVVPIGLFGTRFIVDGRGTDTKMSMLQHSDDPNCSLCNSMYVHAEGRRTIVPLVLVHTNKAVVKDDILTVNWRHCQTTVLEWYADMGSMPQ
jgi:hypothetical protein